MGRLLGLYGQAEFWQEYVMEFSKLLKIGRIPPVENLESGPKDGWGMTMSHPEKTAMVPLFHQLGSAHNSRCFRNTGQVSRILKRLRTHGIIKKAPKSYRLFQVDTPM